MTPDQAQNDTATISAAELRRRLDDPDLTIVDVRPLPDYNGWRRSGEARGGHIPGAAAFPSAWLESVDDVEVERLLHLKGIVPSREVVLYGDETEGVSAVRDRLTDLGHKGVRTYEQGWSEWAAEPSLPVEGLPNYDKLVHTDWLREVLDGGKPEAAPEGSFLVLHVNFGVPEEYEEGHIPGALYLDTNLLESREDWNRRSPEELEQALCSLGITHDTTVILYGRDTEGDANEKWPGRRAGQIAASRAAMILRYCGVDDVRLLDGGYDWWVRAGNPLETVIRKPAPVSAFGVQIPLARTPTTCSTTATWTTRCAPTRRSPPTGRRPVSPPTSGWPSIAGPAGAQARPGSTPISWVGRRPLSTTAAGSNGARTRSTIRSRWGSPKIKLAP